ncbi:hypothetical protein NECID01_1791 [Nematocida sp. AWRm77]|nr:hypothetical protein NECID01_1791 [Nematocida sp. AWRm77]
MLSCAYACACAVLVGLFAGVGASMDMEKLDRVYYRPVRREGVEGSERRVGGMCYVFKEDAERKEFNPNASLVGRIDKIFGLGGEVLEHVEGSTKIRLEPFKSITLETEDGRTNVGTYSSMYEHQGEIAQRYTNGDQCDICKGKKWEGSVIFLPRKGPLELIGPVESSTCTYKLVVQGDSLGREETYKVLYWEKKKAPEEVDKEAKEVDTSVGEAMGEDVGEAVHGSEEHLRTNTETEPELESEPQPEPELGNKKAEEEKEVDTEKAETEKEVKTEKAEVEKEVETEKAEKKKMAEKELEKETGVEELEKVLGVVVVEDL